jgi:hypothetical protein
MKRFSNIVRTGQENLASVKTEAKRDKKHTVGCLAAIDPPDFVISAWTVMSK